MWTDVDTPGQVRGLPGSSLPEQEEGLTRNWAGLDQRFSVIAGALDLSGRAMIDGEVVVIKDGLTNFSELQVELAAGRQDKLVFCAFDLLYLNVRGARQIERKAALANLLEGIEAPGFLVGDGQKMFGRAAKLN